MNISVDRTENLTTSFLLGCLVLLISVRIYVVLYFNINWDEFSFLGQIYAFKYGELTTNFQTLSARLFSILVREGNNEAIEIRHFRSVMLVLQIWTSICLYWIAKPKVSQNIALIAVIAYLGFTYNVTSGASFRTDPIAISLLMTALVIVCRCRVTFINHLFASFFAAVAVAVTIKSAMLAPALVALTAHRLFVEHSSAFLAGVRVVAMIFAATVIYFAVMTLHGIGLEPELSVAAGGEASQAFKKVALSRGFFPRWPIFTTAWSFNSVTILLGGLGAVIYVAQFLKVKSWAERVEILGCLLLTAPFASLLIYRNAFPYFYGFALAPAAIFVGLGLKGVLGRISIKQGQKITQASVSLIVLIPAITIGLIRTNHQPDLTVQVDFINEVKKIFPNRVAYLDRNSMIGSYETAGFFMSTWGLEKYQEGKQISFVDIVKSRQPKFIIANTPAFNFLKSEDTEYLPLYDLMAADKKIIKDNYIHHWDRVWVAGKDLSLSSNEREELTIHIAGDYTVYTDSNGIMIDDIRYKNGDVVNLMLGKHTIWVEHSDFSKETVRLKWGDNIYQPMNSIPYKSLYTGF